MKSVDDLDDINSGTTNKAYTSTEKTKLAGVAAGATSNDTDANLKARANHTGTQTASTISDFNTAADARISAQKGQNSGLATLDGSGKVPSLQLPSFVDDVLEFANIAAFPATGSTGVIYVALDTNKVYRWGGSSYAEISPSPGSTDSVPEGSTNKYFSDALVEANVEVAANTASRHSHANKALLDTYTQTNANLADAVTKKHAHANQAVLDATTASFLTADETKLDGIAAGATVNSTDAQLRDRSTHTGTQTASTVSNFQTTVSANADVAASVTHAANTSNPHNVTKTQVGLSNVDNTSDISKPTSTATQTALNLKANTADLADVATSGDYTDLSNTPAIPDALTDLDTTVTGIQLNSLKTKVDGIASGATANDTDANLKNRSNHTGTQALSTISDVTTSAAEINLLDGVTASTAELNILDGVTATASELNALDGITATATELNHIDGVTSGIQAQIDSKQYKAFVTVGSADADYVTDGTADEVQIQAAIDAVNTAGGGTVLLKPGTYTVATSVLLKSKITLQGSGQGSTIITGPASDVSLVRTTLTGTTKTIYTSISARDITFKSSYGTGLVINNTDGVLVTGCEFYFTSTTPIRQTLFIQHCRNVVVSENYAHDYTGNGLSVTSSDYFTIANNIIVAGINGDDGIDVDYDFLDTSAIHSTHGTVTGNVVKDIGRGNGIRVENSDWVTVSGNTVDNVTPATGITAGILINASTSNTAKHITVVGNSVSNCVSVGIGIDGTNLTDVVVVGNTVEDCGQTGGSNPRAGILLGATGVLCGNNLVDTTAKTGTDSAGVLIFKKDGHLIQNNIIKGCATGLRTWNGDALQSYTGLVVTGNRFDSNSTNAVTSAATSTSRIFSNYGLSDFDATTTAKGVIQLAGDLAGTAASPTVTGLSGKVTGPASATDNAIVRFDATTGKLIQNSAVTISDGGALDIGAYGSPEVLAGAVMVVKADTNSINGVEFKNVNTGTGADFRFLIKDTTGHYLAFAMPGTGNTASTLFGLARATTDFIFSNAGTARTLAIGTLQSSALVFGTNSTERMRIAADGSTVFSGPIATALATKTTTYAITATDSVILADATSSAFMVTLPTAVGCSGRQYSIKKIDSSANAITVGTTSSQTVDGSTTKLLNTQYQSCTVVSNNSNWFVL